MKTIEENNRLIAEFMGFEVLYRPQSSGFIEISETELCDVCDLQFHTSWEWLMPVVEEIEDFRIINGEELEFQIVTYEDEVKIVAKHSRKEWEVIIEIPADGSGKKENTYRAVVQFIEWYNEQKTI